jgi:hypothetical protein
MLTIFSPFYSAMITDPLNITERGEHTFRPDKENVQQSIP